MQFLYTGYYDAERMDALSKEEIDALMSRCDELMNTFNERVNVLSDWYPGLTTHAFYWRDGVVQTNDEPDRSHGEQIGSLIVFEARDLDQAMELASLHPTTQVAEGETYGWRAEVRPLSTS
ncbi:YciI family protein [uncultured Exiguobacterium sp.]|uniref:YciI family protein n=1 Tax=uncultured Exiguobacterium sp. TaxID=202669 RepID=UPI0025FCB742|nr:YciI family protein [uncultured Exiguobacterium sp.]